MSSNEWALGSEWSLSPLLDPELSDFATAEAGQDRPSPTAMISRPDVVFGEDLYDMEKRFGSLSKALGGLFHTGLSQTAMPDYSQPTMEPQPLSKEDEETYLEVFGEGALAGALGGSVASGVRQSPAMASSAAAAAKASPFHGPHGHLAPLAADRGAYEAAFASNNPYVAASYAGPHYKWTPDTSLIPEPGQETFIADWTPGQQRWKKMSGGSIYPMRIGPDEVLEIPTEGPAKVPGKVAYGGMGFRSRGHREWPEGFSSKASDLPGGTAQVVRGVIDPGLLSTTQYDPQRLGELPSEQWAYKEGSRARPAGPPMTYEDVAKLGEDAAKRLGIDLSGYPVHGSRKRTSELPERLSVHDQIYNKGVSDEDAERIIKEIENDPKFKGQKGKLLFRGLTAAPQNFVEKLERFATNIGRGVKSAFSMKNLGIDAAIGALVGGATAVAGKKYGEVGQSETGGILTPPHPRYSGTERGSSRGASGEEIRTIAQRREDQREEWRGHLLERAIEEHGIGVVNTLLEPDQDVEDLRPSQLSELLGDMDMERPPPVTAFDVAEESLEIYQEPPASR